MIDWCKTNEQLRVELAALKRRVDALEADAGLPNTARGVGRNARRPEPWAAPKTRRVDLRELTFYVISRTADDTKRVFMAAQLRDKSLRYEFINGVKLTPPFMASTLSHYRTLCLPDLTVPFAILEDHCQFSDAFRYVLNVPEEAEALYLGVSLFGLETPGAISPRAWGSTRYAPYGEGYLRVFNMLGQHGIVYLSEHYHKQAIAALLQALTNPQAPYPGDVACAMLQPAHVVLTPDEPMCYQHGEYGGDQIATRYPLGVLGAAGIAS